MAITIRQLAAMKRAGGKIPMVTAYDYTAARIADAAGIPILLVVADLPLFIPRRTSRLSIL